MIPLVENEEQTPTTPTAPTDIEGQVLHKKIIIFPSHARRVSSTTILFLLIIALAGVGVGIIGGKILYNEYLSVTKRIENARQQSEGWVQIPISPMDDDYDNTENDDNLIQIQNDQQLKDWDNGKMDWKRILNRRYFQESFEIDPEQKYEKIDVPDFRNGRSGRFIHDFNTNYTGIIDVTGKRCFVMPLNRQNVLPPSSLFDLVQKMWEGYYKVDTDVVRETMRVVTPPVTDMTEIGSYIDNECGGMPIYKLEKYVGGVAKRSADQTPDVKFGQFAGKGILEFDIVNIEDVLNYERQTLLKD